MIYSSGNAAKQWILEKIHLLAIERSVRILDLGCGNGSIWDRFSETHPHVSIVGVDTDEAAVSAGNMRYAARSNIRFEVQDAQKSAPAGSFDVVTAMSAIEHVVDRAAFVKTVWESLANGGVAFLNYDAGHFRSHNLKERVMVPVSQLLAKIGIEGPYMKQVDDVAFITMLERQGFFVVHHMKQNASCLKKNMKRGGDDAIRAWVDFETQLNDLMRPDELDSLMFSTTFLVRKP